MSVLAEVETAPDVMEATVNYVANNGEHLFTYTGAPGSNDRRRGGTFDPRQVKMHNGRLEVDRFKLDRDGFRFVDHRCSLRRVMRRDNQDVHILFLRHSGFVEGGVGARHTIG